jgi:hypothetical protein
MLQNRDGGRHQLEFHQKERRAGATAPLFIGISEAAIVGGTCRAEMKSSNRLSSLDRNKDQP